MVEASHTFGHLGGPTDGLEVPQRFVVADYAQRVTEVQQGANLETPSAFREQRGKQHIGVSVVQACGTESLVREGERRQSTQ